MRLVGVAHGVRCWAGLRKSTATRSHEKRAGVLAAHDRDLKQYATPSWPAQTARLRLPPVVVGGPGDAQGEVFPSSDLRCDDGGAGSARRAFPLA